MADPLFLHQCFLDSIALMRLGHRLHLPKGSVDLGYLAHCQLAQWFPDLAPKPFALPYLHRTSASAGRNETPARTPPKIEVLAYSPKSKPELFEHARAYAKPESMFELEGAPWHAKEMPSNWKVGMPVGFEVRICPVTRSSAGTSALPEEKRSRERDVFLVHAGAPAAPPPGTLDRRQIYSSWVEQQISETGGAVEVRAQVESFQLSRLVRRTQGSDRSAPSLTLPDVVVRGALRVSDEAKFRMLLARGVGRHRSFGFGMMLLRPPRAG